MRGSLNHDDAGARPHRLRAQSSASALAGWRRQTVFIALGSVVVIVTLIGLFQLLRAQFRRRFLGNRRSIRTFGDIVYDYLGATSGQLERVLPPETGTCTGDHGHAPVKPMFADFGHPAYAPCV